MRFGIVSPSIPALPDHCALAEELGFESAWLFDSHMVYADVFVTTALCAQRTSRMTFGTGIAVAPSRIAPVAAHSFATLNQLFPGRIVAGIGTGNTGRRTMGLPPMRARDFREYVLVLRGLLRGETVDYREGDLVRPIRFLHPDRGIVSLEGPIPVLVAALGPQALALVGEAADGFISFWASVEALGQMRAAIDAGAAKRGRDLPGEGFRTVLFHNVWVTRPGERADSPAAKQALAPSLLAALRYYVHAVGAGSASDGANSAGFPAPIARGIERLQAWMRRHDVDPDRDYDRFYEGYFLAPSPEQLEIFDDELVRAMAIVGSPDEVVERLRSYEAAGVDELAIVLGGNVPGLLERFTEAVLPRW